MFDVGFSELVLIFVIALIVLGPERLPKVARTAGRWLGRARQMARSMQYELERELDLNDLGLDGRDASANATAQPRYGAPPGHGEQEQATESSAAAESASETAADAQADDAKATQAGRADGASD